MMAYSWSVLQNLHRHMADRPFDLINFPEYGAEGFAFQINRSMYNWVPVIVQLHAPLAMLHARMAWPAKDSNLYRIGSFMEGESIRLADGWMASSANIADFAAGFYDIPREEIDVVHCGVDCDMFRPAEAGRWDERRPTVLFVGNVTASKGIESVFEAVLRLRQHYPGILLRVVGKGDFGEKLFARAAQAGAQNNVEHIPHVGERQRVAQLFQQADVFASPADHENGVANVYVEAMACGCPVIAGNAGGAPEAVSDGRTGLLVPPRDVKATATAINRILGSAELRQRMGSAARQRAEEYFSQDKYIQRVLAAYHKTMERAREKLSRLKAENGQ